MLRRIGSGLQTLVGLVVVAGAGWVVYTSITEAPAVVAAVVTGVAAVFGLFLQRHLDQEREEERQRRERMTPIYEQLVTSFYKSASGGEIDEREQAD